MNQFIANHIIVIPAVAACVAAVVARIDSVILFALRFFSPDTIKSELDRLDALAKARVDKDAAAVNAKVTHAP